MSQVQHHRRSGRAIDQRSPLEVDAGEKSLPDDGNAGLLTELLRRSEQVLALAVSSDSSAFLRDMRQHGGE